MNIPCSHNIYSKRIISCSTVTSNMASVLLLHFLLAWVGIALISTKVKGFATAGDLQQFLCSERLQTNKHHALTLNASENYKIQKSGLCVVNFSGNSPDLGLVIKGEPISSPATIICQPEPGNSTTGFAFINVSNLIITNVRFVNCGATLPAHIIDSLNYVSELYYTQYHAALLLFLNCKNVSLINVSIETYYGFAILAFNMAGTSVIASINVTNSTGFESASQSKQSVGSGVMLHLASLPPTQLSQILIKASEFKNNFELIDHAYGCIDTTFSPDSVVAHIPVVNAAGLTVIYGNVEHCTTVTVEDCDFETNLGSFASAMLVLHLQHKHKSNTATNIRRTTFTHNFEISVFGSCGGGALVHYMYNFLTDTYQFQQQTFYEKKTTNIHNTLTVSDSSFYKNLPLFFSADNDRLLSKTKGAILLGSVNLIKSSVKIKFYNVSFVGNEAGDSGSCISTSVRLLSVYSTYAADTTIVMYNVTAMYNKQLLLTLANNPGSGIFSFQGVNNITIYNSSFSSNIGSVLNVVNSNLYLAGNLHFSDNHANSGAAIGLYGTSHLYITDGLQAYFQNNTAQLFGGAIYSEVAEVNCAIQPFPLSTTTGMNSEFAMFFSSNSAGFAGNSLYIIKAYSCRMANITNTTDYYNNILFYQNAANNQLRNFSTDPESLQKCSTSDSINKVVYPGQKQFLELKALDLLQQQVFASLYITPVKTKTVSQVLPATDWMLANTQKIGSIQEKPTCTTIELTIFATHCQQGYLESYSNVCTGALQFSSSNNNLPVLIEHFQVHMECPLGFQLDNTTGACECSSAVHYYNNKTGMNVTCQIDKQTLSTAATLTNSWAGYVSTPSTDPVFGISSVCPLMYCNNSALQKYFNYSTMCIYHRTGTLCGQCKTNFSVVFGSYKCMSCSPNNWQLALVIPVFLAVGLVLVLLFFSLRLTLATGTINGLIFYANAANAGILDGLGSQPQSDYSCFSTVFLSLMNLDLGFPLCFLDKMDQLLKTSLLLVFPAYLLLIVSGLILISRFSIRLSNLISSHSVQVLITMVHISFSKLLIMITAVYTPATVYLHNTSINVWYWDGSVPYGHQDHLVLICVVSVVVLIFVLPYIILLLAAKPLMRVSLFNKYLRPVVESVHAPYKDKYQYWFVARLLLLIGIYLVYTWLRGTDFLKIYIITGTSLVVFLVMQAYLRPFKSRLVNLLDSWLMLNLTVIYTTTWYYISNREMAIAILITNVAVLMVFITFLAVLLYHLLLTLDWLHKVRNLFVYSTPFLQRISSYYSSEPVLERSDVSSSHDYSQLRESALSL